jgi:hypothetical protein
MKNCFNLPFHWDMVWGMLSLQTVWIDLFAIDGMQVNKVNHRACEQHENLSFWRLKKDSETFVQDKI